MGDKPGVVSSKKAKIDPAVVVGRFDGNRLASAEDLAEELGNDVSPEADVVPVLMALSKSEDGPLVVSHLQAMANPSSRQVLYRRRPTPGVQEPDNGRKGARRC